jgi:hypothetical protein
VTLKQLRTMQAEELKAVMVPYIGLAILLCCRPWGWRCG